MCSVDNDEYARMLSKRNNSVMSCKKLNIYNVLFACSKENYCNSEIGLLIFYVTGPEQGWETHDDDGCLKT